MPLPEYFTKLQLEQAKELGIAKTTLYQRRRNGWSAQKACSTPPTRKYSTRVRAEAGQYKRGGDSSIVDPVRKTFKLSSEDNKKLEALILETGSTHGDYLRQIVVDHLASKYA